MVYYKDNDLTIRNMEETDARIFTDEEIAQGWGADITKYLTRLRDQSAGKCVSLTAVYKGLPAGYVNVYLTGLGGAFSGKGLPEIVDFGVLEKYRRKGIGSKLMDAAEKIAGQYADTVWLGVGLHSGYGSAQRMYVSVQFSRSVVSDSLRPHELQHARPLCPSPTPGVHSDSRPSSQ